MAQAKLLVTGGEVIEVQLTSETVVIDTPSGRRPSLEPGHITNRMRLFVRHPDGREQNYDFEETKLGVRKSQRVGIVRGQPKAAAVTLNLLLYNLSSGETDEFKPNMRLYLGNKPFFGPLAKALFFSLAVALIFFIVSHFFYQLGSVWATVWGVVFAIVTYPILWWLSAQWDRITSEMRYRETRKRFVDEMTERVREFAAADAPTA